MDRELVWLLLGADVAGVAWSVKTLWREARLHWASPDARAEQALSRPVLTVPEGFVLIPAQREARGQAPSPGRIRLVS